MRDISSIFSTIDFYRFSNKRNSHASLKSVRYKSRLKSSKDHDALRITSRFISLSTKSGLRIYNRLREALRCTLSEILSCAADGRVVRGESIGGDRGLGNCVLKRILQRRGRGDILALLAKSCAILLCGFAHSYIREKSNRSPPPRETFRV